MICLHGKRGYLLLPLLILLIVLLIAGAPMPCYAAEEPAGWYHQDSGTTVHLGAVAAADTATAWVVGMEGTILKTENGGEDWLPQESGTTLHLRDVCAVDGDIVWAVGGDEVIGGAFIVLRTMNGGDDWETIAEGTGFSLAVIEAVSAEVAWVGGYNGVISRTIDGGGHWSIQNTGTTSFITDISAVDENNAWAVGGETDFKSYTSGGVILKTTDGGWNWTARTDESAWMAVEAVDMNNVWILGLCTFHPGSIVAWTDGTFIKTTDGGASWITTITHSYGFSTGMAISAADASTAWIVGPMDIFFQRNISKSTNGCTTWACQELSDPQVDLVDVSAASPEVAWAVGIDGTIVHTEDGGFTQPAPHIDAISPDSAKFNGTDDIQITITGSGFGSEPMIPAVAFGKWPILGVASWSDTEITFSVSWGILYNSPPGQYEVTVTGEGGTSNTALFTILEGLEVFQIQPNSGIQYTLYMDCNLQGADFKPGAVVRIENESASIGASYVNVLSHCQIAFRISLLGAPPGLYDVVVINPDGSEARLEDAFTVTPVCGSGGGAALLMLGLSLGLLSLAGSSRLFKRKK